MRNRGRSAAAKSHVARGSVSLLVASGWLALVLVAAKAASGSGVWFPNFGARVLTLIAASFSDVLFAFACGAVGELAIFALRRWPRALRILRAFFIGFFALCAIYAIAAVGLFRYFNRPLTFNLLGLVGNAATVRSSILERVTLPVAIALLLAPVIFLALVLVAPRSRRARNIMLAIAALWVVTGCALHARAWEQEELEYLWLSPHAELLRTTALHLTGAERPAFPKDFPPQYLHEFRTFAARGAGATSSSFVLPPGAARPRNVIIIVLESVGAKYLRLYGNPLDVVPNLTAAAQHALVFDNIYAHASFTYASFRPINFSVFPGLPWHYALVDHARPLPQTLASAMRARGSRTAYFTSGDLDWGDQRSLLERAGDFTTLRGAADLGCPLLSSWGTEDRCAFDRLIGWIDDRPNDPFFTICWTDQTHDPFLSVAGTPEIDFFAGKPRPKFAGDLNRYLNNVHRVDAQLGRLFATLRERGIADDTLVVVTGDHGEAFGDPHQQRGHAWSVYDEEARVPLILWNPRLFPQPQRVGTIGGHVDLNPTLADVLGIPPRGEWQGHSLFDPGRPQRAYFMAIAGGDLFGVRDGDWKYIYDVTAGCESLFNVVTDPHEQHNVAATEAARCVELRRRVAAWVTFEDAYLWGREN